MKDQKYEQLKTAVEDLLVMSDISPSRLRTIAKSGTSRVEHVFITPNIAKKLLRAGKWA